MMWMQHSLRRIPIMKPIRFNVSISTVANGKFVFSGSGSGHGVGLSQKGAQGMAQMGYDYKEILCHYYTGITIEG